MERSVSHRKNMCNHLRISHFPAGWYVGVLTYTLFFSEHLERSLVWPGSFYHFLSSLPHTNPLSICILLIPGFAFETFIHGRRK